MDQEQLSVIEKSGFIKSVIFATVHHCQLLVVVKFCAHSKVMFR